MSTASPSTSLSDNELQLKVHQVGVIILLVPFCVLDGSSLVKRVSEVIVMRSTYDEDGSTSDEALYYFGLAFVNAFAFTHYK